MRLGKELSIQSSVQVQPLTQVQSSATDQSPTLLAWSEYEKNNSFPKACEAICFPQRNISLITVTIFDN